MLITLALLWTVIGVIKIIFFDKHGLVGFLAMLGDSRHGINVLIALFVTMILIITWPLHGLIFRS